MLNPYGGLKKGRAAHLYKCREVMCPFLFSSGRIWGPEQVHTPWLGALGPVCCLPFMRAVSAADHVSLWQRTGSHVNPLVSCEVARKQPCRGSLTLTTYREPWASMQSRFPIFRSLLWPPTNLWVLDFWGWGLNIAVLEDWLLLRWLLEWLRHY